MFARYDQWHPTSLRMFRGNHTPLSHFPGVPFFYFPNVIQKKTSKRIQKSLDDLTVRWYMLRGGVVQNYKPNRQLHYPAEFPESVCILNRLAFHYVEWIQSEEQNTFHSATIDYHCLPNTKLGKLGDGFIARFSFGQPQVFRVLTKSKKERFRVSLEDNSLLIIAPEFHHGHHHQIVTTEKKESQVSVTLTQRQTPVTQNLPAIIREQE